MKWTCLQCGRQSDMARLPWGWTGWVGGTSFAMCPSCGDDLERDQRRAYRANTEQQVSAAKPGPWRALGRMAGRLLRAGVGVLARVADRRRGWP